MQVPLTQAMAARALDQVDVDMFLVKAVRPGAEHGRKAAACGGFHGQADLMRYRVVGRPHDVPILEPHGADVERIRVAMLAQAGTRNSVAGAAVIGIDVVKPANDTEGGNGRGEILAHKIRKNLSRLAAEPGRRRDHDRAPIRTFDAFEFDDVAGAALARPGHVAERRENSAGRRKPRLARRQRGGRYFDRARPRRRQRNFGRPRIRKRDFLCTRTGASSRVEAARRLTSPRKRECLAPQAGRGQAAPSLAA
jgi:hypothetical protein